MAEIVATRRAAPGSGGRVGAVVLAAGCSRRAGPKNKLLHPFDGEPMIRRVVKTVLEADTKPCVVVLGHEAERVRQALNNLPVTFVVNASYAEGMGTSIGQGVEAIAATQVDAAFIVLGDMPLLRAEDLERLRIAHCTSTKHLIIAPEAGEGATRRLGNPVLWPRRYFDELASLRGNQGAKSLLLAASGAVLRVPIDHRGVLFDVDTIAP
ncbi:MAG: nucleotidyltransferase family protein [Nannocystaceae bacterium]